MLKVGYTPCTQDTSHGANIARVLEEAMAEAQLAEKCGFDSCFFTEHHQQADYYIPNPLMLALAAGQKTQRIKVGTCVLLLPLQHPVHVAEDTAIVDQMTGGRLILGLGVGYSEADFGAFGISVSERAARTVEGIEIIQKSWGEGAFSYQGKHYRLDQVSVTPKPRQKPHPPIWLGAGTLAGIKRAARLADGWVADLMQGVAVIKGFAQMYRDEAKKCGKTPFVVLMRDVWVADSMEAARRSSDPLMYTHRFYFRNKGYVEDEVLKEVHSEEDWTFDRAAKNRIIVGSPQDCREQLQMWQEEVRPDYAVLRMRHPGGPTHSKTLDAIRIFGEKILPAIS
jgi:alkanesulfonate monooxygenase SsuD/methylene tetrahydromethanopterin reductase-like flavin-dependent oxidoreductase (luciferase family)